MEHVEVSHPPFDLSEPFRVTDEFDMTSAYALERLLRFIEQQRGAATIATNTTGGNKTMGSGNGPLLIEIHSWGSDPYPYMYAANLLYNTSLPICTSVPFAAGGWAIKLLAAGTRGLRFAGPDARCYLDVPFNTAQRENVEWNRWYSNLRGTVMSRYMQGLERKLASMDPLQLLQDDIIDIVGIPRLTVMSNVMLWSGGRPLDWQRLVHVPACLPLHKLTQTIAASAVENTGLPPYRHNPSTNANRSDAISSSPIAVRESSSAQVQLQSLPPRPEVESSWSRSSSSSDSNDAIVVADEDDLDFQQQPATLLEQFARLPDSVNWIVEFRVELQRLGARWGAPVPLLTPSIETEIVNFMVRIYGGSRFIYGNICNMIPKAAETSSSRRFAQFVLRQRVENY